MERSGIAGAYSDPVDRVRAQDESTYANSAMGLASDGGWPTPKVMGRFLLYKPPLLVWCAGASLKIFGRSLWALRLPDLLAAALAAVLVFAWSGGAGVAAWAALALLLADPLWRIFAQLCYTDMLLACCFTGAMFCLRKNGKLDRVAYFAGFVAFVAGGVMAKNVAGLLPLVALGVYWPLAGKDARPSVARIAAALGCVFALAAPWHVYQLLVHRQWFWADYVQVQLLGFGTRPPGQHSPEGQAWFYAKRFAATDPLLTILALGALPSLVRACRKRSPEALLLAAWMAAMAAALLAFRYRNLPYALPLIPALALAAVEYAPHFKARWSWPAVAIAAALLLNVSVPGDRWGTAFRAAPPIPEARALREYYELGRPQWLFNVAPADEFYSFALPGLRVRYVFVDPAGVVVKYSPHYAWLGITVTGGEFENLDALRGEYARRLRSWGLDSDRPLATAIVVPSAQAVAAIVLRNPNADFSVPLIWVPVNDIAHRKVPSSPGRVFLLARESAARVDRTPLPKYW